MTRTDIHRPSVADPAEYEEVGFQDQHPEEGGEWYSTEESRMLPLFDGHFQERGGCDHCGAHHLRYVSIQLHRPTQTLIHVGMDCAQNLGLSSKLERQAMRFIEQQAKARKRDAYREAHPDEIGFLVAYHEAQVAHVKALEEDPDASSDFRWDEFYGSLHAAWRRKGELSEKQLGALQRSIERKREWERERAEQAAADPDPSPVPVDGERIQITGRILSSKYKDGPYGSTLKMLVLDDRGFKVWGTQPEGLLVPTDPNTDDGFIITADYPDWTPTEWIREGLNANGQPGGYQVANCRPANRGDRVQFTATVTRSERDEDFGFFKRPTQAETINEEVK